MCAVWHAEAALRHQQPQTLHMLQSNDPGLCLLLNCALMQHCEMLSAVQQPERMSGYPQIDKAAPNLKQHVRIKMR